MLIPFLTEHTIRKMLELLILKCFATGRNPEKTFGQDLAPSLDSENGIVHTLLRVIRADNRTFAYMDRSISRPFRSRTLAYIKNPT